MKPANRIVNVLVLAACAATPVLAASPVGTAFTYQGLLKDGGVPVTTTTGSFRVALYDAESAGNQIGGSALVENVTISSGLFTIPLDFGSAAFADDARWLQIAVYKDGSWVTLTPRQRVTPTPQAVFAQSAASLSWPLEATFAGGSGVYGMMTLDYAGDGTALTVNSTGADSAAIHASTTEFDTLAILGTVAGEVSTAIAGYATAAGAEATGTGGAFMSWGNQGTGVFGFAQSSTGTNYGVYGRTNSASGYAGYFIGRGYFSGNVGLGVAEPAQRLDVAGTVQATGFKLTTAPTAGYVLTCDAAGVGTWQPGGGGGSSPWQINGANIYYAAGNVGIGLTNPTCRLHVDGSSGSATAITANSISATGYGLYATNVATNGTTGGVRGSSASITGRGVYGEATAVSGTNTGVYGASASTAGRGVYGESTAATGNGYGIYGRSSSPWGRGVFGEGVGTTGQPVGVEGYVGCPTGYAVSGFNEGESGDSVAVFGITASPDGAAIVGQASRDETTGFAAGVRGENFGAGAGVYGKATHSTAVTYGVMGEATSANGYAGHFTGRGYFSGNVGIGVTSPTQKLDVAGTIQMTGFKLTTTPTAGYVLTADASGVGTWQPAAGAVWQQSGSNIYFTGGNVGIGTNSPGAPFDLAGGNYDLVGTEGDLRVGSASYRLKIGVATSGGSAGLARIRAQGITGTPKLALGAGSFDMLTVTSSNVGVGTLAPDSAAKLDVSGKVKATSLQVTTGATAGYVLTADASGNATWQVPSGADSLWDTGASGVIYYNDGDVGIGTDTPDADLQVACSSSVRGIHVTGAVNGVIGEGSSYGVRGEGGNNGVYGVGTSCGVRGYCAGAGRGLEAESVSGVGARVSGGGSGTAFPALYVTATNAAGIGIFSTCTSTDANAVFVNQGSGDIIKGFSGTGGGDLVFRVENNGKTTVGVLAITGGSDLSEQFDVQADDTPAEPGMVVCIDPDNAGKLSVSTQAYSRTVAGVISGAGGVATGMTMGHQGTVADGQHPVALTGRVYVWADASNGPIEPGDLLTTSATPGHAMKVTDHERAQGAVLGKAMSRLESGRGLVLVLVSLQ